MKVLDDLDKTMKALEKIRKAKTESELNRIVNKLMEEDVTIEEGT